MRVFEMMTGLFQTLSFYAYLLFPRKQTQMSFTNSRRSPHGIFFLSLVFPFVLHQGYHWYLGTMVLGRTGYKNKKWGIVSLELRLSDENLIFYIHNNNTFYLF